MKKNILLTIFFLIFANQNSFAAQAPTISELQITTAAELFETIKMCSWQKCYTANKNPLSELAHFIKAVTSHSDGAINLTILSVIKAFLARESKNSKNPFNICYKNLSIYLEQIYQLDKSRFDNSDCALCIKQPKNFIILSCNHIFCYDCLFERYTKHNLKKEEDTHIQCPLCMKRLDDSVLALFISDERYEEKSGIAMKEYAQKELQDSILRILLLGQHN